jgi:hypothetical protein
MADRKLLEAAARAAGYIIVGNDHPPDALNVQFEDGGLVWVWMPLTDDGDALRLAVKLRIAFELFEVAGMEFCEACASDDLCIIREPVGDDEMAATRRAITRAAAAIGEAK